MNNSSITYNSLATLNNDLESYVKNIQNSNSSQIKDETVHKNIENIKTVIKNNQNIFNSATADQETARFIKTLDLLKKSKLLDLKSDDSMFIDTALKTTLNAYKRLNTSNIL